MLVARELTRRSIIPLWTAVLVGWVAIALILKLGSFGSDPPGTFDERPVQEMIRSRWRAAEHHSNRHNDEIRASIETPAHGLGSAELVDTTTWAG